MKRCILFVLPIGLSLGGVTIWSINLARALRRSGIETLLLLHKGIRRRPRVKRPIDQPAIECKGPPAFFATHEGLAIYSSAYEQNLPVTFIPNWSDAAYYTCSVASAKYPSQTRIIGIAHGDQDYYYDLLSRYEPSIHLFVAVSHTIATKLKERIPHRANHIHTRINFVDVRSSSFPKPATPIVMTFAGRIEEEHKRVSDLVEVIRTVSRSGCLFQLNVVGNGDRLQWLKANLATIAKQSASKIVFHGQLSHAKVLKLLSRSHIFLQCSSSEGASLSMLEAMASGCVPVVTAVSGAQDVIVHGQNGFLSSIGDVCSLSDNILKLATDETLLTTTSRNAQQSIQEFCSIDSYVEWFLSLERLAWSMEDRPFHPGFELPQPPLPQQDLSYILKMYWRRTHPYLKSLLGVFRASRFVR